MTLNLVLHVGTEHPNLVWVLVPALITFVMGIGVGMVSSRRRSEATSQTDPAGN